MSFHNGELLANPTRTGVTLSLIPAEDAWLYVEYGAAPGVYPRRTPLKRAVPGETVRFRLDVGAMASEKVLRGPTRPGREHVYRVRCSRSGLGTFGAREEHRFRTLRRPGETFSFAFVTDSHAYQLYARKECEVPPRPLPADTCDRTMDNIAADESIDFVIVGGDDVQTHCRFCPACTVDGESAGRNTVRSQREAELRYRVARRYFERAGHRLPVFLVLGNHDGEAGFGEGSCEYGPDLVDFSRSARLLSLPNAAEVYSGSPEGNYFAFESGDALFVVLDVMRYTTPGPLRPEDWTLGAVQTAWLETTLAESSRTWKFVILHHLVGGLPELTDCFAYGRGGLRSTTSRMPTGTMIGEQALIQDMMERYGAQFLLYGHDHVFALGEKPDASGRSTGVHYLQGGTVPTPGK